MFNVKNRWAGFITKGVLLATGFASSGFGSQRKLSVPLPGSLAEFILPHLPSGDVPLADPAETVTFRTKSLDDRGFNRTLQNVAVPTLTVYRPENPAPGGATVVICPGGGYRAVVIDREGHAIARWLQGRGITAAVLKYRLPGPETFSSGLPVSQQDALEALRFMRRHVEDWGLTANRIGIMGFSAGGHLAGSTAVFGTVEDGSRPDFVAMLYPVVAMGDPEAHRGSRERLIGPEASAERRAGFSLELCARSDMPPFFLCHARDDTAVPFQNSTLLAEALREKGVGVDLLITETGGHGFSLGRDPDSARWPDRFLDWVNSR